MNGGSKKEGIYMDKTSKLFRIFKELSTVDIELLHHLYLYRCLSIDQSRIFIYKKYELSLEEFQKQKINHLLKLGVVEMAEYRPSEYVLFLTTYGVDIVRYNKDIPLEIFNPDTRIVKRGYYRAGELRISPRLVNHQVFLNQFILEFSIIAKEKGIKWKYYDEKYVSQYFTIRPDGLIQLLDTDFFIEMDMGTESKKQLSDKWNHYRDFIRSSEFTNNERRIMVLFVTENIKNLERRKDLVRFTAINQISDLFNDNFDMVIGSNDELLQLMFDVLIPNLNQDNISKESTLQSLRDKHDFQIDFATPLKEALNDSDYEFYIRKVNDVSKRIITENGRLQEYVLDDYTFQPLSVIGRIQYHKGNANMFQLKFGRKIPYIVVVNDESTMIEDLKVADSINVDGVYYTTPERLVSLPFHEAIFQYDITGDIYHFTNSGFHQRVVEKKGKE